MKMIEFEYCLKGKNKMNQILPTLLGLAILISCNNEVEKVEKRELVPNPEKYNHDGTKTQINSIKFKPDTSIGKISLISSTNIQSYLGENVMDRLVDNGLPSSSVISNDKKQRFTFYFHPGSVKNEFSEFKINYVDQKERGETIIDEKEFISESGIKLGMTMGDLRAIKGEPDSISTGEINTFYYKITDFNNSIFLRKYNMPLYYAEYKFQEGYLIEFKFGFEYP